MVAKAASEEKRKPGRPKKVSSAKKTIAVAKSKKGKTTPVPESSIRKIPSPDAFTLKEDDRITLLTTEDQGYKVTAIAHQERDYRRILRMVAENEKESYEFSFNIQWIESRKQTEWLVEVLAMILVNLLVRKEAQIRKEIGEKFGDFLHSISLNLS